MFAASVEDVEQRYDHDDRRDGRFYWKTVIKDNDDEKEQTDVERERNFLIFLLIFATKCSNDATGQLKIFMSNDQ